MASYIACLSSLEQGGLLVGRGGGITACGVGRRWVSSGTDVLFFCTGGVDGRGLLWLNRKVVAC